MKRVANSGGSYWWAWAALVAIVLSFACASPAQRADRSLEVSVEKRGLDPSELVRPDRLTPEMKAWLEESVFDNGPPKETLAQLIIALRGLDGEGLTYDPDYTGTAAEVFTSRRYNCLSFSFLFVSMARELGLGAYFVVVDSVQEFQETGDLVVVSQHVSAGYGLPAKADYVEFNVGPEVNYRTARRISDVEALALFYSNRGTEALLGGDPATARDRLETAAALAPDMPLVWTNLGVAYRQLGETAAAFRSYRRALELDAEALSAYQNLASLMDREGDHERALELLRTLESLHSDNPYTYLALGDMSRRFGELERARDLYRKAHRMDRKNPTAMAALGEISLDLDERERAREWLERAAEVSPDHERVARLRRQFVASELGTSPN
jgi:Flp pilus assembly protein TadD